MPAALVCGARLVGRGPMTGTGPGSGVTPAGCLIRIILVDDQELVRTGFRMVLDAQPDMQVVGEAADGNAAIDLARRLHADVMIMDARMPGWTASRRPGRSAWRATCRGCSCSPPSTWTSTRSPR